MAEGVVGDFGDGVGDFPNIALLFSPSCRKAYTARVHVSFVVNDYTLCARAAKQAGTDVSVLVCIGFCSV